RDHDPADLLLRQDVQEAAAGPAGGDPQGRQGSRRIRPSARVEPGCRQARRVRKGRQAQEDPLRRSRTDEEARRPRDGRVREGNRRRGDLRQDQLHVAFSTQSGGRRSALPPDFFGRHSARQGGEMRKFIDGYARLLNWLLGASVAILVLPVTLQMIARQTGLIPAWIWTEEMSRFFFIW